MRELRGKTALVTGAAGGIGRSICAALAEAGCRVVGVDLPGAELRTELQHRADVRSWDDWQRLAEAEPDVAILVNNAGLTVHAALEDMTVEDIDRVLDVNLKGVTYGCRAFLPGLRRQPEGHIVNLASMAAMLGIPSQSTYCASKWGVRGLSASLRMEVSGTGVGVTAVLPGAIATGFLDAAPSRGQATTPVLSRLMKAHGTPPERVARRVVAAIRRDRGEIIIGAEARATAIGRVVAPGLVHGALGMAWRRWGRR